MKKLLIIALLVVGCEEQEPEPICAAEICCCYELTDFTYSNGYYYCDQTYTNIGESKIKRVSFLVELQYSNFSVDYGSKYIDDIMLPSGESITQNEWFIFNDSDDTTHSLNDVTSIKTNLTGVTCE